MSDYDLILAGAGHAHLAVLRRWALVKRPPGRIALLGRGSTAWYAGMLPGLLAGRLSATDSQVELAPLCRAAKVELIEGRVLELDPEQRRLQLVDGRSLQAQWLSLDVGAGLQAPQQQGDAMQVLATRPMDEFLEGWQGWQQDPRRLAILGGTPVAIELALALADQVPRLALFCGGRLLPGQSPGMRLRALGYLRLRGVQVREHCPIGRIEDDWLLSGDEPVWRGRRLLLAGGARAWPWLKAAGLACDEDGFVHIHDSLQSLSHPRIFAAGECATLQDVPRSLSRSSRQGRVLAGNLAAALQDQPLQRYRAPRHGLTLLATGNGGALLGWWGWNADGLFCGRCKDWLDRRFVQRHRV